MQTNRLTTDKIRSNSGPRRPLVCGMHYLLPMQYLRT